MVSSRVAAGDLHDIAQSQSLWQLYVAVDDLEAVLQRVRDSGGSVGQPISSKPWGERTSTLPIHSATDSASSMPPRYDFSRAPAATVLGVRENKRTGLIS